MRFVALALLMAALAGLARPADAAVTTRTPSDDVGISYWCEWGYDWDDSCYRDRGRRLPVGGVDDKVWRSEGILLSLADWQDFDVSGPYLPSMGFADPALRPQLVVTYTNPTGPAP